MSANTSCTTASSYGESQARERINEYERVRGSPQEKNDSDEDSQTNLKKANLVLFNPLLHKTVHPVKNMGDKMLFALLEALMSTNETLSAKVKEVNDDTCTLTVDVIAPAQKPLIPSEKSMTIKIKLVEKPEEESKDDDEDETQLINFEQVGGKQDL